MKKWTVLWLICGALTLSACGAGEPEKPSGPTPETAAARQDSSMGAESPAYHKITAETAREMLDQEDVVLVDVRTGREYADGHIPDAVSLPVEEIGEEMPALLPDPEAVILVYCRTGVRSKNASDKLAELGYQKIYDMGGIVDWPYETVSGKGGEDDQ